MVTVGPVEIAATAGTVVLVAERAITRPGPAPHSFTRPESPIDVIHKHRPATNHLTSLGSRRAESARRERADKAQSAVLKPEPAKAERADKLQYGREGRVYRGEEQTMKAVRIHEFGGPEVLGYEDVEIPEPGPVEGRVKLAASGVNFIDVYQRTGLYPGDLPRTLGLEGAGEVDAVGEGVDNVSPGDYVAFASTPGSYAEYVVAPAENLVPFNATLVEPRVAAA